MSESREFSATVQQCDQKQDEENFASLVSQTRAYLQWLECAGVVTVPISAQAHVPPLETTPNNRVSEQVFDRNEPRKISLQVLMDDPGLPNPFPFRGEEALRRIFEVLGDCRRCQLHHNRSHVVFGQGHPSPDLVFVGEGPGAEEDRTGLPFVGAAGDLLNRMILAMGMKREDVYICNVVKCRPPGNRTPEAEEVAHCGPFLRAQLQALAPKVIVALGATPTKFLLQTSAPISRLRGRFSLYEQIPVMPTYHPAYLLRTPSAKRMVWEDLQMVMQKLKA